MRFFFISCSDVIWWRPAQWLARCWRVFRNLILPFSSAHLIYLTTFLLFSSLSSCFSHSLLNSGFWSASPGDSTRPREPDHSCRWDGIAELHNNGNSCPDGALEEGRGACVHPRLTYLPAGHRSPADPLCQGKRIYFNAILSHGH